MNRTGSFFAVMAVGAISSTGCAVHTWRATPVAEQTVREKVGPKAKVRAETPTGLVLLDVASVRYPTVEGRARPGGGEVQFDVTRASRAESVAGAVSTPLAASQEEMRQAALVGKLVRFETEAGPAMISVTSFEYPLVRGQPRACPAAGDEEAPCPGLVQLDLREASRLEVREVSGGKSVLVTLAVFLVLSLVI